VDGILNVCKPAGPTSHDVVARLRRLSGQRRIGHAGTLDPAASGVLLTCLGQATRILEYMANYDKEYCAEVRFGVATDTYDAEGQPCGEPATPTFDCDRLAAALAAFVGRSEQVPPPYSAIKVGGQPAHRLARAGHAVQLAPRPVEIQSIDLLQWQPPNATFVVRCSKGTYIRSLAHDLGQRLGCGAHLSALCRTASGPFHLKDAVTLEQLQVAFAEGFAEQFLQAADEALLALPAALLSDDSARRVTQGQLWHGPEAATDAPACRAYNAAGTMVALLHQESPGLWQPRKVFAGGL
jgi:tRNA pseudouridine55 synthase